MKSVSHSEATILRGEDRPVPDGPAGDNVGQHGQIPAPSLDGQLRFYHPNGKGTGTALQLELRLNRRSEDRYNCFFLETARQVAVRTGKDNGFARFDWAGKITTKLAFLDVCAFLNVLEGQCDGIGPDGKGLYHQTPTSNTLIGLSREKEAGDGVMLRVSRKDRSRGDPMRMSMRLSACEATGLRHVLTSGMIYLALWRAPGRSPRALTGEAAHSVRGHGQAASISMSTISSR